MAFQLKPRSKQRTFSNFLIYLKISPGVDAIAGERPQFVVWKSVIEVVVVGVVEHVLDTLSVRREFRLP